MRPHRVLLLGLALSGALLSAGPAQAAWNNVFQVCCASCGGSQPVMAMASPIDCAPPCPAPCPQQVCTTQYIQRSYYQPVTTYKTTTYYEPVTTYRTSYYYEPVTTYRYSCYYDPCTCRYQQVATPCTSYRLRSQCCPVTSYLQRCAMTPVTSYQQVTYYEPQTTCCTTNGGAPAVAAPAVAAPAVVAPATPAPAPANPTTVIEQRQPALTPSPGAPNVSESREPAPAMKYDRNPLPPGSTSAPYQAPQLGVPLPNTSNTPIPRSGVRLDRMASLDSPVLQGQVIGNDQRPQAGARVLLISANSQRTRQEARADASGQFHVTLSSGGWLLYTYAANGQPVFQQKIDVGEKEKTIVRLVNR